ncbi:cold shock domain-containing protein [Ferrimonas gelatinilytica]|uniref:Cold shock domain-containing protein n=1 Tax=Ferrimonas gelatinilytica TaxID=1255257 RepID=A0ABP9S9F7_9GAMM
MKGKIVRWMDDRGFGFITTVGHSKEVFVHISEFRRGYRRPKAGDYVEFELVQQGGKVSARGVSLVGVKPLESRPPRNHKRSNRRVPVTAIAAGLLALCVYTLMQQPDARPTTPAPLEKIEAMPDETRSSSRTYQEMGFRCEGKTYCSEMRSCAEAKFYLANCPGTKMDGDGDGIPCERQWC